MTAASLGPYDNALLHPAFEVAGARPKSTTIRQPPSARRVVFGAQCFRVLKPHSGAQGKKAQAGIDVSRSANLGRSNSRE